MGSFGNVIAALTVFAFIGGSEACDVQGIPACVTGFSKYQGQNSAVMDQFTQTQLEDVCKTFNEANICMTQALNGCPSQALIAWSGVEDMFQYICSSEGSAAYLKYAGCFGNTALQQQGRTCNSTYQSTIQAMKSNAEAGSYGSNQEFTADVCTATNRFLQCIYLAVEDKCDAKTADFQLKVTMKGVAPAMSLIHCTLDRTNGAGSLNTRNGFLWVLASLLIYMWNNPIM